ncbi:uncharacterized protein LOC142180123 [Nicotiana tabacum]|uniref:Uncharacterized protein LOC142180123 n=1 Tax=Nicotiana tabacum TaxID=4097 RepID=A0AC58UCD2_TOBAC
MIGIPIEVAVHKLNLDPSIPPVRQKKRPIAEARNKFVREEGTLLLDIGDHPKHLQETSDILMKHNMNLNPEKCAFEVNYGKFLGFLVSQRGIEVHFPVFGEMPSLILVTQKEEQLRMDPSMLTGFEGFKIVLVKSSVTIEPGGRQKVLIYLAVSEVAISIVLVHEDEETRHPHLEKFSLALVVAAQKLWPYFQCHPIAVVTTFPLRNILHKSELSDRLAKWAVEMSEFDIEHKPRTTIKSQVLADFVADFSPGILPLATEEAVMASE